MWSEMMAQKWFQITIVNVTWTESGINYSRQFNFAVGNKSVGYGGKMLGRDRLPVDCHPSLVNFLRGNNVSDLFQQGVLIDQRQASYSR